MKTTMKKKKQMRAISAAPSAMPPNPKIPAMTAMMKKASAHRSKSHLVRQKSSSKSAPEGLLPGAEPVSDQKPKAQPEERREHGPMVDKALRTCGAVQGHFPGVVVKVPRRAQGFRNPRAIVHRVFFVDRGPRIRFHLFATGLKVSGASPRVTRMSKPRATRVLAFPIRRSQCFPPSTPSDSLHRGGGRVFVNEEEGKPEDPKNTRAPQE
jgi:hypothetical protein